MFQRRNLQPTCSGRAKIVRDFHCRSVSCLETCDDPLACSFSGKTRYILSADLSNLWSSYPSLASRPVVFSCCFYEESKLQKTDCFFGLYGLLHRPLVFSFWEFPSRPSSILLMILNDSIHLLHSC